jgi:phosphate transport system ATP-binding protein
MSEKERRDGMALDVRNFNLYYGDLRALKDVNIAFRRNRITALIGPSGCGKSSLLKCLNRMNDLVPGTRVEGKIVFEGKNLYQDMDAISVRRRIGMVFQQPNPFPKSIYDNVAFGPRLLGEKNAKALDEIVERSLQQADIWDELKDRLRKSAMELSGGQQQRLCIARTLAVEPEVILMDEPTSALDPIATQKIENLVVNLKKRFTIIIVTHNMQQAARISEQVGFFMLGDLVEFEETQSFFMHPKDKRSEDYITGRFG